MAQVTMTGNEYAEMLRKIEQGAEIIRFLKTERKVKFTEGNIRTYSSGKFPLSHTFPEWLQDILVKDMVDQLLHMDADEFGLWATTNHHFYHPKSREFDGWDHDENVDLLEYSSELKFRWDTFKAAAEAKKAEEEKDD